MHPHRGIETVTYLIQGRIDHEDSLGNKGTIGSGESQWMTAGSGILHQEMPQPAPRMLGFQLWLNLPKSEKMCEPAYLGISPEQIPHVLTPAAEVRVISGCYENAVGVTPRHIPASIFDLTVYAGKTLEIPAIADETAFVFLIEGSGEVCGQAFAEKTAVLLGAGDTISLKATEPSDLRAIFFSGKPLREPVAWGGPIVMNTRVELLAAFEELDNGTFIKHA